MPADESGPEPLTPAPPEVEPGTSSIEPSSPVIEPGPPDRNRSLVKRVLPWLTSLATNLTLLIVLALLTVSGLLENLKLPLEVSANFNRDEEVIPLDVQQIGAASAEDVSIQSAVLARNAAAEFQPAEGSPEELDPDLLRNSTTSTSPTQLNTALLEEVATPKRNDGLMGLPSRGDLTALVPSTTVHGPLSEHELKERTSLRDVALDVSDEIKDKLSKDSLLVVWLLDGSLSLVDNRKELSVHLDNMYAGLEQQLSVPVKGKKKRMLMNSTVGYGQGVQVISPPYRVPTRATVAMREMGVDETGIENVCQSIIWTAIQARASWDEHRGQIMIVVFTDESGDDTFLLEEAIEVCRQQKVSVSFIGPTAILGTDEGYHRWISPQPHSRQFWLPVMKGPDAAIPERLRLPYWWSTENLNRRLNIPANAMEFPTDEEIAATWRANLPDWAKGAEINPSDYFSGSYSGRELLNLNSGFPPYAYMRMARETGGTYTMFDRRGDRGPFRLKLMRPYAPDYRSMPEIVEEMQYHPLHVAIINSALLTRKYAPTTPPPVSFWGGYIEPPEFRNYCNRALPAAEAQAARTAELLEQALGLFGPNGMEGEYEREASPRWQAWYDLCVGRLLLQSVRFEEYRVTLRMIDDPRGFPIKANQISLFPYATIRSGERCLQRAQEGQRLLQRCLDKNPGTPWAFLAARELEHPVSVDFNWRYIPPPPPPPPFRGGGGGSPAPQIQIPRL